MATSENNKSEYRLTDEHLRYVAERYGDDTCAPPDDKCRCVNCFGIAAVEVLRLRAEVERLEAEAPLRRHGGGNVNRTPVERAFYDLSLMIEGLGAHESLTKAVIALSKARDHVLDWEDEIGDVRNVLEGSDVHYR